MVQQAAVADSPTKGVALDAGSQELIHVIHVVFSLEPGGMENGVVNLANCLPASQFRTTICCLDIEGRFATRLRESVQILALGRESGFSWPVTRKLAEQLRISTGRTVLHTHNHGPLIYASVARALAWKGTPILHGEHAELHGGELSLRRRVQRRVLYRMCRRIHGVSKSVKDQLVSLGHRPEQIEYILNGVDCERFSPPQDRSEAKRALGLPPDSPVIGFVARFAPSKRHAFLLDAFRELGAKVPQLQLLLVGDGGPAKEEVLRLIQQHPFTERIHWRGFQQEPNALYQAMDIFAMPSLREGLANVLLEAMASGVPPVAHCACGSAEVVRSGENGIVLDMITPGHLSDALLKLLAAPEALRHMSIQARKTAQEEFSLQAMVDKYSALYRRVSTLAG